MKVYVLLKKWYECSGESPEISVMGVGRTPEEAMEYKELEIPADMVNRFVGGIKKVEDENRMPLMSTFKRPERSQYADESDYQEAIAIFSRSLTDYERMKEIYRNNLRKKKEMVAKGVSGGQFTLEQLESASMERFDCVDYEVVETHMKEWW